MSETKKVLLTKKHEITGLGSFHKVIPVGIYEVVSYANVYKIVSDGIYKGDNLPKELCQIAKEYSIEYVTKLEIKAARGDQELERLRKELEEKDAALAVWARKEIEWHENVEGLRDLLHKISDAEWEESMDRQFNDVFTTRTINPAQIANEALDFLGQEGEGNQCK